MHKSNPPDVTTIQAGMMVTPQDENIEGLPSQLGKQGAALGGVLAATKGTKDGPVVPALAATLAGEFPKRHSQCERTNATKGGTAASNPKKESNRHRRWACGGCPGRHQRWTGCDTVRDSIEGCM